MNDEPAGRPLYSPDFEYEKRNLWLKFALDRTLAATVLLLLIPLFALIALGFLLQSIFQLAARGPILISEQRMSKGAHFKMLKFCTYYVREDELHAHKRGTTDFVNDRDVTPVGWILRKFYLDELPQLWNILMGHMSFIGPGQCRSRCIWTS
jgi:lipopolysaccharide/colanic/teichoic acid biosynthesis glycosyltransferase